MTGTELSIIKVRLGIEKRDRIKRGRIKRTRLYQQKDFD